MPDPYIYTDSDDVHLCVAPRSDMGKPVAYLTMTRMDLAIAADDAPAVCEAILAAAGRDDVRLIANDQTNPA